MSPRDKAHCAGHAARIDRSSCMNTPPPSKQLPPHLRKPPHKSNKFLLFGLIGFGVLAFAFPFYYVRKSNLDASKPLGSAAIRRGPYANSGSKDAGPIDIEEYVIVLLYYFTYK
jgi:hypothetical protein